MADRDLAPGRYWCDDCNKSLDATEVKSLRVGSGALTVCPTCQRAVRAEAPPPKGAVERGTSFAATLAGAFAYPFRGSTLLAMAAVAVMASFLQLGIRTQVLALAVIASYLAHTVRTTAMGEDDWTVAADDGSTVAEWIQPLLRYVGVLLLVSAPPIWALLIAESPVVALGLAAVGLLYLPAGLVAASYSSGGCLGPFNPLPAIALIARIPGPYALTVAFVALSGAATVALRIAWPMMTAWAAGIPVVPSLLGMLVALIGPTVAARMLGLLVREHAEELFGS